MVYEAPKDLLGTLGINAKLFFAQLVNFTIVLFVMWRWVYRPLVRMMDARAKDIAEGLEHAKRADARLIEADAEKARIVEAAHAEAHAVLEETRAHVEAMRREQRERATQEMEQVAKEARAAIATERQAAFDTLKQDVAELVALSTAKVAAGLDANAQRQLIARAITEIERA